MSIKSNVSVSFLFLPIIVLCLVSNTVYAYGEVNNFGVVNVRVDKSGIGYVRFDQPLAGGPADCISGGHTSHLSFDTNTAGGRAIMSLALSAQATGKRILARGTGTCDEYNNVVESWRWGYVH